MELIMKKRYHQPSGADLKDLQVMAVTSWLKTYGNMVTMFIMHYNLKINKFYIPFIYFIFPQQQYNSIAFANAFCILLL